MGAIVDRAGGAPGRRIAGGRYRGMVHSLYSPVPCRPTARGLSAWPLPDTTRTMASTALIDRCKPFVAGSRTLGRALATKPARTHEPALRACR